MGFPEPGPRAIATNAVLDPLGLESGHPVGRLLLSPGASAAATSAGSCE
jgi:hypothetical protein